MLEEALQYLARATGRQELDAATVKVYLKFLADIPERELAGVLREAVSSCERFPAVSTLRRIWMRQRGEEPLSAAEAWEAVVAEIRRRGYYRLPERLDELTLRAVRAAGGWQYLCSSEQPQSDRARFLQIYEDFAQSAHRRALVGAHADGGPQRIGEAIQELLPGVTSGE